jgi:hypothetical protein
MRGQRNKQAESREGEPSGEGIEIIDVSEHRPRRPPSPKWRELIKKVWEADPLICPTCSREMRIVSLIEYTIVSIDGEEIHSLEVKLSQLQFD